jgi:hypothetical protein
LCTASSANARRDRLHREARGGRRLRHQHQSDDGRAAAGGFAKQRAIERRRGSAPAGVARPEAVGPAAVANLLARELHEPEVWLMVDRGLRHELDAQIELTHARPPVAVLRADAVEARIERDGGQRGGAPSEISTEQVLAILDELIGDELPGRVECAVAAGEDRAGDHVCPGMELRSQRGGPARRRHAVVVCEEQQLAGCMCHACVARGRDARGLLAHEPRSRRARGGRDSIHFS